MKDILKQAEKDTTKAVSYTHLDVYKRQVGIVLLILIMAGMCTQERFFCQFLCPMGAVFAIMPRSQAT